MDTTKAKQLDQIEKNLVNIFKNQQKLEEIEEKTIEKSFKPVIKAIGKVEEKIDNVNKQSMELVPALNKFVDTSIPESEIDIDDIFIPASTPIRELNEKEIVEESTVIEPNIISKNTIIGKLGQKYLPRASDNKFGLYWSKHNKSFMIGDKLTNIDNDDLIINDKRYKGTVGLWRLLTYDINPDEDLYTQRDLENYTKILWETNSIYKNNDPNSKKPKSSKGDKYLKLISNIWKNRKDIEGSGVRKYIDNSKIEYRFIDDFSKLYSLMNYIYAQEKAGHNNFLNEKKAIADLLLNKLNETIEKPEGIKYLIRLWPSIQNILDKEGFGIINDLINNLPFELHVPNYNFLGPGTKLDMRLKRGDKGINKLDEAAKEHDIFYKNHKDVESRNIADKILEEKAIDRIFSSDADLGERLVSIPTAGVMYIKRKLGMGLDPELKF